MARRKQQQQKAVVTKLERIRTPKGTAAFAHLREPDDSFDKVRYRITVIFDKADPEFKTFLSTLMKHAVDNGFAKSSVPIKKVDERLAELVNMAVGTPYIEMESHFKSEEETPSIPIYNARAKRDDTLMVFGTDIVRAEGTVAKWEQNGKGGIKVYLNSVQLLKKNYTGGAPGSTFEEEEEFIEDDDTSVAADTSVVEDLDDEGGDEDPFSDESSDEPDADDDDSLDDLL